MPLNRTDIEVLYSRLEPSLYNLALRWVWNREVAQEIVQEAFIALWKNRNRVETDSAKSYIYRICVNKSKNHLRAQSVRDLFKKRESVESVVEWDFEKKDREKMLNHYIKKLPEKLRAVLLLSELSELSYAEISDILNIPTGTVGSRKNEALRKLRDSMGKLGEDYL